MQLISPYKFTEANLKFLNIDSLFKDESSNFVDIFEKASSYRDISPLLCSIDPYDNTMFNSKQCEKIIKEIENLKKVTEIKNFASRRQGKVCIRKRNTSNR